MPIGAMIGAMGNMISTYANNEMAKQREAIARKENFRFNEMSADAADARTRKLYADLYSPKAQLEQIKEAGLSPSIFSGSGLAGKSGVSGAQGGGAGGVNPNVFAADPIGAALAVAQINKLKAETNNIDEDTTSKELVNEIKKLDNSTYKNKWNILNNQLGQYYYNKETGMMTSFADIAKTAENYEQFENNILKHYGGDGNVYLASEEGRETLREIYNNSKKFDNNISVLANSEESAKLMLAVTKLLNQEGFAHESADAQIQQLKQIKESTELTTKQKEAFNNLIDKLGDGTTKDIVIVLLMLLGQYSHTNINLGRNVSESIKK